MKTGKMLALLGLLGVAGCGGDPDSNIRLVPVKGIITLNGKPMENATVSFVPSPDNKGGTAGGDTTGPEGNYLAHYRNRSGLAPGKYKVTVTPGLANVSSSASVSEAFANDPFMAAEGARATTAHRAASKKTEVKGEFDAEVAESGGQLDFDVKATASAASTSSTSSKK